METLYIYYIYPCIQDNDEVGPVQCGHCELSFQYASLLDRHVATHNLSVRQFACTLCDKSYALEKSLQWHMNKSHAVMSYKCDICHEVFGQATTLAQHKKAEHAKKKLYKCEECNVEFAELFNLNRHTRGHAMRTCDICKITFQTFKTLKSHIRLVHTEVVFHKCDQCEQLLSSQNSLTRHMEIHKEIQCEVCQKIFIGKANLNIHMMEHVEKESLACKECNTTFTSTRSLKNHVASKHHRKREVEAKSRNKSGNRLEESDDVYVSVPEDLDSLAVDNPIIVVDTSEASKQGVPVKKTKRQTRRKVGRVYKKRKPREPKKEPSKFQKIVEALESQEASTEDAIETEQDRTTESETADKALADETLRAVEALNFNPDASRNDVPHESDVHHELEQAGKQPEIHENTDNEISKQVEPVDKVEITKSDIGNIERKAPEGMVCGVDGKERKEKKKSRKKKKMSLSFAAPSERNIIVINHEELTNAGKEDHKENIVTLKTEDTLELNPLSPDGANASTKSLVESKTYKLQNGDSFKIEYEVSKSDEKIEHEISKVDQKKTHNVSTVHKKTKSKKSNKKRKRSLSVFCQESQKYVRMANSGLEQGSELCVVNQENDPEQKEALAVEILNALVAIEDSPQQIEVGVCVLSTRIFCVCNVYIFKELNAQIWK